MTNCTEGHHLTFTLQLPIPSKKNSRTAHLVQSRITGKWRNYIHNSERWSDYEAKAIMRLKTQLRKQINGEWEHYNEPCYLSVAADYESKRMADIPNILDGVCDLVQDAGAIANDRQIIGVFAMKRASAAKDSGVLFLKLIPYAKYNMVCDFTPTER